MTLEEALLAINRSQHDSSDLSAFRESAEVLFHDVTQRVKRIGRSFQKYLNEGDLEDTVSAILEKLLKGGPLSIDRSGEAVAAAFLNKCVVRHLLDLRKATLKRAGASDLDTDDELEPDSDPDQTRARRAAESRSLGWGRKSSSYGHTVGVEEDEATGKYEILAESIGFEDSSFNYEGLARYQEKLSELVREVDSRASNSTVQQTFDCLERIAARESSVPAVLDELGIARNTLDKRIQRTFERLRSAIDQLPTDEDRAPLHVLLRTYKLRGGA